MKLIFFKKSMNCFEPTHFLMLSGTVSLILAQRGAIIRKLCLSMYLLEQRVFRQPHTLTLIST